MANEYWATLQGEELIAALNEKRKAYETHLVSSGDFDAMKIAAREYVGEDENGNTTLRPEKAGSADQLRIIKTGHFRTAVRNKLTIAKADSPTFVPVARNTDEKSQAQTLLAKAVIDYEMDEGGDEKAADEAVEIADVLRWSELVVSWEPDAGEVAETVPVFGDATQPPQMGAVDATQPPAEAMPPEPIGVREVKAGAPKTEVFLPIDVSWDFAAKADRRWVIIRRWKNKWDVAAEVSAEDRDEALEQPRTDMAADLAQFTGYDATKDSDEVPVYEFRHAKTPAMPQGRCVRFLASGVVLEDGPLPYEDMGARQVKESSRFGTQRGYSSSNDALGLQKVIDVTYSIDYSNARTFGGRHLLVPDSIPELTATKLTEGVSMIRGGRDGAMPVPLNFLPPSGEISKLNEKAIRDQSNIIGLDDLSTGRETRALPGVAMALLDERTQRAVSGTAGMRMGALKWLANQKIRLYRDFASYSRRLPLMVGESKVPMLRDFAREDLASIDRVMVQTASPLMKQPSGRLQVAEMLKGMADAEGKPFSYEKVLQLVETGQLETSTEAPMSKLLWARSTAEKLAQGQPLQGIMVTDDPTVCIPEWLAVINTEERRANQAVATAVTQAVMQMLDLWSNADPRLLALLHIPPPPVPMMAPTPGQGGTPPPEKGAQSGTPTPGASNEIPGQRPRLPNLPNGEPYSPTAGVNPNG